jgi:hypothetical protein
MGMVPAQPRVVSRMEPMLDGRRLRCGIRSSRLRKNITGSSEGTVERSPGRQSWGVKRSTSSPGGTAKNHLRPRPERRSAVPSGLNQIFKTYPGLTSWATLNRPFGTQTAYFRSSTLTPLDAMVGPEQLGSVPANEQSRVASKRNQTEGAQYIITFLVGRCGCDGAKTF